MGRSVDEREDITYTPSPTAMTEIGIEFSELVESYGSEVDQIRVVVDSMTTLLLYSNLQTVFRFMHVFTSRVENADAIGLYTIESTAHGTETMNMLSQLFDGVVEFDRDGEFTVDIDHGHAHIGP
jgi:KaiC/GvpD/RAD55 family RecA-like ATPase